MKNENGKPTQAESHSAPAKMDYISWIIKLKENSNNNFSYSLMKNLLQHYNPKTIQKIQQDLENDKIIKKTNRKLPNNEKEYEIIDMKKAKHLKSKYEEIYVNKFEPIAFFTSKQLFGKPFTELGDHFYLKFVSKEEKNMDKLTPKKLYLENICPLCDKKLRDFKHKQAHELDRKCLNCYHTFYFDADENGQISGIIRVIKN